MLRLSQAVFLALLAGLILPLVLHAQPGLAGQDASYVVLSGSMVPAFDPGDMIFSTTVDTAALGPGDIITFRAAAGSERLYTHRILRVVPTETGLSFETKGDANEDPDPALVPASAVLGRMSFTIPWAGYVKAFTATLPGFIFVYLLPGSAILIHQVWTLVAMWEAHDRAHKAKRVAPAVASVSVRVAPPTGGAIRVR